MGIKAENSRKIRELEEEFSDEVIAELFHIEDEGIIQAADRARHSKRLATRNLIVIVAIVVGIVIALQFFSARVVYEYSMEDTILPRDLVLLALKAYDNSEIKHGDLIMIETNLIDENGDPRDLIKRVIGLPGDTVEIRDGGVYRDGQLLNEPYVKGNVTAGEMGQVLVPEGYMFVLGDNRRISIDSRDARVGYVGHEEIIGKVFFRMLPFSRSGPLR